MKGGRGRKGEFTCLGKAKGCYTTTYYLEFLQSRRLPILVVVNEMCASPITISSSWAAETRNTTHSTVVMQHWMKVTSICT